MTVLRWLALLLVVVLSCVAACAPVAPIDSTTVKGEDVAENVKLTGTLWRVTMKNGDVCYLVNYGGQGGVSCRFAER